MATRPGKVGADDFIATGLGDELTEQPRTALGQAHPVELHTLLGRDYPSPDGIIKGGVVVREGLHVTGGPPKRGKSLLGLQKILTRATGQPWLGFATTPGISLVFQAEIPEPDLQARIRIMQTPLATPIPPESVFFVTHRGLRLDRREDLRVIRGMIEGLRPDYVQIDPLARFFSGDENSSRDVGRLVASLDELIQTYHLAIELVHHTSKPGADDGGRAGGLRLRGSSALFAAVDSALVLDRTKEGDFKLSFELRHGREPEPMLLRRTEHLWLEPAGPSNDLLRVASIVLSLPLRYGQLLDAIQADLDVKKRTAESLVAAARKAGIIAVDAGIYRTTANYRNPDVAVDGTTHE
jgi:hypothetical protein